MNGGMQRCFHIMHQLAKHFALTAIIHQDKEIFLKSVKEYPAIASAKIFSTKNNVAKDLLSLIPAKVENALRSRWYQRVWNTPADSSLIKYYPILTQLLKCQKFDAIILENSATLNAVRIIRRYDKEVPVIYNAHNVDSNLAKAALTRREISENQFKGILDRERNLHNMVSAVLTCSKMDKERFEELNAGKLQIKVVPNGMTITEKKFNSGVQQDQPEYILFCGSLWSLPNAEGLHWFCKKIWPGILAVFPNLKLLIVGSGELPEKYLDIRWTQNIEFTGAVDDVKTWYNEVSVVVAPLLTGSGTRLKILEAMALGVPVVSTEIGAEGIDYKNGENILMENREEDFAEKLVMLLINKNLRIEIATAARRLVEQQYEWDVIGMQLKKGLQSLMRDKKVM